MNIKQIKKDIERSDTYISETAAVSVLKYYIYDILHTNEYAYVGLKMTTRNTFKAFEDMIWAQLGHSEKIRSQFQYRTDADGIIFRYLPYSKVAVQICWSELKEFLEANE